jgi:hypothetical protein
MSTLMPHARRLATLIRQLAAAQQSVQALLHDHHDADGAEVPLGPEDDIPPEDLEGMLWQLRRLSDIAESEASPAVRALATDLLLAEVHG